MIYDVNRGEPSFTIYGISDDAWPEADGPPALDGDELLYTDQLVNAYPRYYYYDVTEFVRNQYNGDKLASFHVTADQSLAYFYDRSSGNSRVTILRLSYVKSSDAALAGLTVSEGSLDPVFHPETTQYCGGNGRFNLADADYGRWQSNAHRKRRGCDQRQPFRSNSSFLRR